MRSLHHWQPAAHTVYSIDDCDIQGGEHPIDHLTNSD